MDEQLNGNANAENTEQTTKDVWDAFTRFTEHQRNAIDEAGKAIDALFPPGFKEHGNEARREFVKGFKVLVDSAISELEKASREFDKNRKTQQASDQQPPSTTGKTKVKVQID
ncbi:MAG: hypothetical protein IH587_08530 [Anaerolineae bacterium]|nr:hypothetical protein [Anaerolineae bacterium]